MIKRLMIVSLSVCAVCAASAEPYPYPVPTPAEVRAALEVKPYRPYEFTLAGRTKDIAEPVAALESADGWSVSATDGTAKLVSSTERALFGKGVCRFVHSAASSNAVFRLTPKEPIAVAKDADTVSLWIYGNNIRGRAGYACGRNIPQLRLFAEFSLDGKTTLVDMWRVGHPEWFVLIGAAQPESLRLIAAGAKLTALVFKGGPTVQEEQFDITSLCVFRDPKKPLVLPKRPKLPIPTTARGILPADPTERFEFRYPKNPSESWDDLAFRVPGGEWIPLAIGGGVYPASARKNAKVVFSRYGDSVIADVTVSGGAAEEVRFGGAKLPSAFERVPIPYYTYCDRDKKENRPWLVSTTLGGKPLFLLASMDWYRAHASMPLAANPQPALAVSNGGAEYRAKTDGRRNDVCERFVWTLSRDPQKVLPEIPHPASPYRALVGSHARAVHFSCSKGSHEKDLEYLRTWKRRGLEKIILTDHEVMWRDGWETFTYRTMAAPKKGGDEGQLKYTRAVIDDLGYVYGPYNTYVSIAPANRWWTMDSYARLPDGNPVEEGGFRSHGPKTCWAAAVHALIAPEIQRKFKFNCAYCDVVTCLAPWDREDYDARNPGGGMYAASIRDYADILLTQRETWKGPVCSEGGIQYLYAGLHDCSYAQDSQYGLSVRPWLVDFDLLKIHPLESDCGAGLEGQFYCWWRTVDDTDPKASAEWRQSRWLAATVAFGHSALISHSKMPEMMRDYYAIQSIATRYSVATAKEIRYGAADGALLDTAQAIATGAYRRSQTRVVYTDGTVAAANGSRTDAFKVTIAGETRTLPPNGWWARSADGKAETFSGLRDGAQVEYAFGPDYIYVNGLGKPIATPCGATDGILVRKSAGANREEVIAEGATRIALPYEVVSAEALDEQRKSLGKAAVTHEATGSAIRPVANAVSYLVTKK